MPLITCPECEHKVSDQASLCPGCGYSFRKQKLKLQISQVKQLVNPTFLKRAYSDVRALLKKEIEWEDIDRKKFIINLIILSFVSFLMSFLYGVAVEEYYSSYNYYAQIFGRKTIRHVTDIIFVHFLVINLVIFVSMSLYKAKNVLQQYFLLIAAFVISLSISCIFAGRFYFQMGLLMQIIGLGFCITALYLKKSEPKISTYLKYTSIYYLAPYLIYMIICLFVYNFDFMITELFTVYTATFVQLYFVYGSVYKRSKFVEAQEDVESEVLLPEEA